MFSLVLTGTVRNYVVRILAITFPSHLLEEMQTSGIISKIKSFLLPSGTHIRKIKGGLLKGLKLPIDYQSQSQIYLGTWERENQVYIRRLASNINTFIDVGASTGPISLYALAKTEAKRVFAFEPQERFHAEFHRVLQINGFNMNGRLRLLPYRVGIKDTEEIRTLDSFTTEVKYPCFVKIDVDGPEAEVLQGAKQLLKGDVRLVIETHSKDAESRCIRILQNRGYRTNTINNAWWRLLLPEQRPLSHNRWLAAQRRK